MGNTTQPIRDKKDIEKLLLSIQDPRDRLYVNFQIRTAYRSSEVISLKWEDLFEQGHVKSKIRLRVANKGKKKIKAELDELQKKKKSKPKIKTREVIITPELQREIVRAYEDIKPHVMNKYIFTPKRGNSMGNKHLTNTGMNLILKKYQDLLKINPPDGSTMSTHCLRKTGAYWFYTKALLKNPATALKVTSNFLGHSNPATTMIYLGLDREEISEISRLMSIENAKSPMQKIQNGVIEWRGYWTYLLQTSDNPESDMSEYIESFCPDASIQEIDMALEAIKALM